MLNLFVLKIRVKSLMTEAQVIRKQESRFQGTKWCHLSDFLRAQRRGSLRAEARDTHIAYGFLKGRTYRQIEDKPKTEPDWENIALIVEKYGTSEFTETLVRWRMEKTITVVNTAA